MRDLPADKKRQAAEYRKGYPAQRDGNKAILGKKGFFLPASEQNQHAAGGGGDCGTRQNRQDYLPFAVNKTPDHRRQHKCGLNQQHHPDRPTNHSFIHDFATSIKNIADLVKRVFTGGYHHDGISGFKTAVAVGNNGIAFVRNTGNKHAFFHRNLLKRASAPRR